MLKHVFLAAAFAAIVGCHVSAQPAVAPQGSTASAAPTVKAPEAELIALREQNKLIKEYHSSLLDTVYWALALLGGTVAVIAGASWLVNFKLYDADKQRLNESFNARIKEIEAQLATSIAAAKTETLLSVQAQHEAYADRASREAISLRASIGETVASLTSRIDKAEQLQGQYNSGLERAQKKIASVEATARQIEELVWELKGIPANVIITQCQGLQSALQAANEWQVHAVIRRMGQTVELHVLQKGKRLRKSLIDDASEQLRYAAKIAPDETAKVLDLLAKVPTEN